MKALIKNLLLVAVLFNFIACGGGGDNTTTTHLNNLDNSSNSEESQQQKRGLGALIPTEEMLASIPDMTALSSYNADDLPTSFDLSDKMPPVRNQGGQGSCASWAVGYYLKSYHEHIDKNTDYGKGNNYSGAYSPAFLYNSVKIGSSCNSGSYLYKNLDRVKDIGIASWKDMPYNESKCDTKPSDTATTNAKCARILDYQKISIHRENIKSIEMQDIKYYLSHGNPIVIGIKVYNGFDNPKMIDGEFFYKEYNENGYRGGHAIVIVGYDDSKNAFKIINSWGTDWGNNGFLWIDYNVFSKIVFEAYRTTDARNECKENSSYISIDKQLLAFNTKLIGSSYNKSFIISNSGTKQLNITNITVPTGYSVNWKNGIILAGDSQNVTVTFTPTEEKVYSGTLSVISDADNGENTIILSGKGMDKTSTNLPPVANAGDDITIKVGESVKLDASKSTDDGEIISYEWKLGSTLLSNSKSFEKNDFSAGIYRITLKVTDDKGLTDTDTIIVTVSEKDNLKPIADAGEDISVKYGEEVTLDASKSKDSDGRIVAYEWREENIVLSKSLKFTKKDFSIGKHTITLIVTDNNGAIGKDIITVTVAKEGNLAPIANAGNDITVKIGEDIILDASKSRDEDGNIIEYKWNLNTSNNNGSTYQLSMSSNQPKTILSTRLPIGVYTMNLTVIDNDGQTGIDSITITVIASNENNSSVFIGTFKNDVINGTSGDDNIDGKSGNDIIYGEGGNDIINGGSGNDVIYGDDGNDIINGESGNDVIYSEDGDDKLNGGSGNDTIYIGSGNNKVNGDLGVDTVIFNGNYSDYTIKRLDNGSYSITNNRNTTIIKYIEIIKFDDKSISLQS